MNYCKKCVKDFSEEGDAITVSLSKIYTCGNCGIEFKY